jgi:hypothetical protein
MLPFLDVLSGYKGLLTSDFRLLTSVRYALVSQKERQD